MNMHFGYFLNYSEIKQVCQLAEMHCEKLINQITQHWYHLDIQFYCNWQKKGNSLIVF